MGDVVVVDVEQRPPKSPVSRAIDQIGAGWFTVLIVLYTAVYWVADAAENMVITYLAPSVQCYWGVSASQASFISSIAFIGQIVGFYVCGALSDVFGRHRVLVAAAVQLLVFSAASGAAPSYEWLVFFRVMVGVGMGSMPVTYTLVCECLPTKNRGIWLMIVHSFWGVGNMYMAGVAWAVLPSLGFRWLLALSVAPAIIILATCWWFPESPHWLYMQGRVEEAEEVLRRIARINGFKGEISLAEPEGVAKLGDEAIKGAKGCNCPTAAPAPSRALVLVQSYRSSSMALGASAAGQRGVAAAEGGAVAGEEGTGSVAALKGIPSASSLKDLGLEEGAGAVVKEAEGPAATNAPALLPPSPFHTASNVLQCRSSSWRQRGTADVEALQLYKQATQVPVTFPPQQHPPQRRSAWQQLKEMLNPKALWCRTVSDYRRMFALEGGWLWVSLAFLFVWFTLVLSYYGITMMLTYIQTQGPSGTLQCLDGKPDLAPSKYRDVFLTTIADIVAMFVIILLIETRLGRKWLLLASLAGGGIWSLVLTAGLTGASLDALVWLTRGFASAAGTLIYVITPEAYPTTIRGFAMGVCSSLARLGGFTAPYIANGLHAQGRNNTALVVFGVLFLASAAGTALLPDRRGKTLKDTHESED